MTVDASSPPDTKFPKIGVGAVVIDDSVEAGRRIVLVRRAKPPLADRWSLPGGKLEYGERIEEGLRREVLEESGLEVEVGPLIEVVEAIHPPYHYVILDYVCRRTGGSLRAGDDASAVVFVRPVELGHYGVTEAVERVVTKALAMC